MQIVKHLVCEATGGRPKLCVDVSESNRFRSMKESRGIQHEVNALLAGINGPCGAQLVVASK
jgi:hypothetical protein